MKGLLASRFTAWAAALAAAVVAWFVGQDFITVPDAAKATEDLTTLLSGVFAAVAAVAVWLAGVVFRKFTRGNPDDKSGGGSAGGPLLVAMAGITAWGMALGGALSLTSCVVGGDSKGGWYVKPDPMTVTEGLKYLVRQDEESAKAGLVQWSYYDPETGKEIPKEDYAAWGITAGSAE